MKAIKKKDIFNMLSTEDAFYKFIISFMILVPLCEFATECFSVPFVSQPSIVACYGCIGILMALSKLMLHSQKTVAVFPSNIFFILLLFFAVIALLFSCNIYRSLAGFDYDEQPYHFMAYYSLMYASTVISDTNRRKKLLYGFALVGLLHCVIAFAQTLGFELSYCYYTPETYLRYGNVYTLTQNSNWYGALSVIFVGVFSGLYLFHSNNKKRFIHLLLAGLALYCSMCSKARLAWVGNFCIILFYIISFIIMRKKMDIREIVKRFTLLFFTFILAVGLSQIFYQAVSYNVERTIEQSKQDADQFGSLRGYIWRYGLESVPHHWLTGTGLDNYAEAFFENPDWDGNYYQDKGHNEYLHTLVTQGVFAALNYIIMLIYACVTGVKTVIHTADDEERRITWILLGMFIGYATQAFFNSSVINVAPYFWIIVGLTMPRKHQKPLSLKRKNKILL